MALAVMNPDPQPILLEEQIDLNYVPDRSVLLENAEWLGMDLDCDADLLWIVEEFLKAPLPHPWKAYEASQEEIFFFNPQTGESTWHHPCDDVYRQLYRSEKEKKTPLKVVTVSCAASGVGHAVLVVCTGMSGDCLATTHFEAKQTFAELKTMLAMELNVDREHLRLVLPSAAVPADDDIVGAFAMAPLDSLKAQ